MTRSLGFCIILILLAGRSRAETTSPPLVSPEQNNKGGYTFRLHAPHSETVRIEGSWKNGRVDLTRGEGGIWSVTIPAIEPGIHTYGFNVDGMDVIDRANPHAKPGIGVTSSLLVVPAPEPEFHDYRPGILHGEVRVVEYPSQQIGGMRRMRVYTPPGYDDDRSARFPVLYLCHGYTSDDRSWTVMDHAHWIADNLIAEHKAKPLVIVMPNGHVKPMPPQKGDPDYVNTNAVECDRHLTKEVIPLIESRYRVRTDRKGRAIAGLSMGADQTIYTALSHPDLFAWAGAFAPGARSRDDVFDEPLQRIKTAGGPFSLFQLTCGKQDGFLTNDRALSKRLRDAGVDHEYLEIDGGHTHEVFRRNLRDLLPRLWNDPGAR